MKPDWDFNARDTSKSRRPLLILTVMGGTAETVRIILDNGANVNGVDDYGGTAIMYAANWNKPEVIKLLLDREVRMSPQSITTAISFSSFTGVGM